MARVQTAELDLWFDLQPFVSENPDTVTESYIDLGQCLSLVNRRFYRQGLQYAVAGVEVISDATTQTRIYRIPESWPAANAWHKALALWQESQDQVLDNEPSLKAKYHDFKIFYNATHQAAGMGANMLPIGYITNYGLDDSYEWAASEVQIPNVGAPGTTVGYNLHMLGDDVGGQSKGVIHGYAMSRSRPQQEEPNVPQPGGWMTEMFDVGDNLEEIRDDIVDENDEPPYSVGTQVGVNVNQEFYPGGMNTGGEQKEATLITRQGTALAQSFAPGFTASCGLLEIQNEWSDFNSALPPTSYSMRITLVPGDRKGVMTRTMQDVN